MPRLNSPDKEKAIIIGAGPAGLTAALELLRHSDIKPVILEESDTLGGISRTVNYKGNRMDIGGHRFFSKSDTVMKWWLDLFPVDPDSGDKELILSYQNKKTKLNALAATPQNPEQIMLVRNRLSRIFYLRKFFPYPIKLSLDTLKNLGLKRTIRIGFSYVAARIKPIKQENSLEDFLINRFGKELYRTFFKDYTEKVWGISCREISAEWGAQRIKGLSITKAISHALRMSVKKENSSISQKNTETSLIERFLYPKYGPGQMWEEVARQVVEMGGEIHLNQRVKYIKRNENLILSVEAETLTGLKEYTGTYFFSTMPVKNLISGLKPPAPEKVQEVASGLVYRDFITVGLLLKKLAVTEFNDQLIKDNWIYIQENDVKIGRLQIFNNWSPYMVANPEHVWLGLEYFCNEGDELWQKNDGDFMNFAISELHKINIIDPADVLDGTVVRMPKTYPAYFGSYDRFSIIREFTDSLENLFLIGRNGMHKYNNQDHSMLTAMTAVQNIIQGIKSRENIWNINTEMEYHEEK